MVFKYIFICAVMCALGRVARSVTIGEMHKQEEICIAQFPSISQEVLDSIRKNLQSLEQYYKDHADLYCYTKCFMQGIKLYSEDGKIDTQGMKDLVHLVAMTEGVDDTKAMVHDAVEKCVLEAGSDDHCEKIGHYFVCKIAALDGLKLKKEFCPKCYAD